MSKLIFTPPYSTATYEDENTFNIPTAWEANFVWTGRDDYLEWVTDWKTILRTKIAEIHAEKAIRRNKAKSIEERNSANYQRQALRAECRDLMIIRKIGKQRSVKQRDELRKVAA